MKPASCGFGFRANFFPVLFCSVISSKERSEFLSQMMNKLFEIIKPYVYFFISIVFKLKPCSPQQNFKELSKEGTKKSSYESFLQVVVKFQQKVAVFLKLNFTLKKLFF